jgi:hypothetical protein
MDRFLQEVSDEALWVLFPGMRISYRAPASIIQKRGREGFDDPQGWNFGGGLILPLRSAARGGLDDVG